MTADGVRLRVHDANLVTARKSWNIEFSGGVKPLDAGAALVGVVDIPDRRALRILSWEFRLAGVLIGAMGLASGFGQLAPDGMSVPSVLIGLLIGAGVVLGATYLTREGERAAGEDAHLLALALHDILNRKG